VWGGGVCVCVCVNKHNAYVTQTERIVALMIFVLGLWNGYAANTHARTHTHHTRRTHAQCDLATYERRGQRKTATGCNYTVLVFDPDSKYSTRTTYVGNKKEPIVLSNTQH
jgi:hypothetical protein